MGLHGMHFWAGHWFKAFWTSLLIVPQCILLTIHLCCCRDLSVNAIKVDSFTASGVVHTRIGSKSFEGLTKLKTLWVVFVCGFWKACSVRLPVCSWNIFESWLTVHLSLLCPALWHSNKTIQYYKYKIPFHNFMLLCVSYKHIHWHEPGNSIVEAWPNHQILSSAC